LQGWNCARRVVVLRRWVKESVALARLYCGDTDYQNHSDGLKKQ
jgi:hypothetical protein